LCSLAIFAVAALAYDSTSNTSLMPLDQVHSGMKGYGMTVFQGSKPERFDVEVLGILEGMPNPKQSIVIARLGGPLVDRTGVFAGMSGSPVYIDGKLVGAVAYAFPFAKEPIAGITPIKYMIDIFEEGQKEEQPRSSQRVSFKTLIGISTSNSADSISTVQPAQLGARAASDAALVPY